MGFDSKIHISLPFKLDLAGMPDREKYLRDDWFWTKEPETIAWIQTFEHNTIFWDIGANIGCYSLYAATLGRVAQVYAFEPFAPNYERLKANIELNQCWRTVKAEQIAISNETGMANFATKSTEIGSSGGQIGEIKGYLPQMAYPVEVTTGDSYANIWGCPNYVKIDVDGIEEKILAGMPRVLNSKSLKSVLIEDNTPSGIIHNIMLGYGFEPWVELERLKLRHQAFNRVYRRK